MNELTSDQSERDRGYIQALLDGDQPSFSPEEKIKVLEILRRVATMGSRRVGPTKQMLIDLCLMIPGDINISTSLSKTEIVFPSTKCTVALVAPPSPTSEYR